MRHPLPDWAIFVVYLLWWAAASIPLYERIVKHYAGQGITLHFVGHLAALGVSVIVGLVMVVAMAAVLVVFAIIVDNIQRKIKQMRDDKSI